MNWAQVTRKKLQIHQVYVSEIYFYIYVYIFAELSNYYY